MFRHLSMLAGYVVCLPGLVAPTITWKLKNNNLPGLDVHRKNMANWIIIAAFCFALVVVFIGVPLLIVIGILSVVFTIIGGVKAKNGEVWPHPMSMRSLN